MRMNHINLPVADVTATRAFFETYFGFRCIVEKGVDTFVALVDDGGMVLALSNFDGDRSAVYPKWFHVGFMQDTDTKVDGIFRRLRAGGIEVGEPEDAHGAWTFSFTGPGGFSIEVSHQKSSAEGPSR